MKIRIAGITQDSIVDGKGLRFVVFTQGCPHHCPGCHNPETHPLWGGKLIEVQEVIEQMNANPLSDGLTLSGGEPFFQPYACAEIAKAAKDRGLSVWCYTGYRLDELNTIHGADELLKYVDVLVDGRFIQSLRSLDLDFRGSSNQRVIDMNAYRQTGKIELLYKQKSNKQNNLC